MGIYDLMQGIQQQGEEGRKRGLQALVGKAYAAPQDQRQQILATVAQRGEPGMALEADKAFGAQEDNVHLQMAKRAREVVALYKANPAMAQQVYQNGLIPIAQRAGIQNAPMQLDDSLIPGLEKLASAAKDSDGTPAQQQYAEWLLSQVPEDQRDQTLGVLAGYKPRPSSAAIQYKEVMGDDGVTRWVAMDPREVGSQVIGGGQTFGSGVGNNPGQPAPSGPTQADMEGDIQLANAMISAGIPAEKVDAFLAARGQRAEVMPVNNVQPAPQSGGALPPRLDYQNGGQVNPFQSRPQEQQKFLDEQATQAAKLSALPTQGQIEAQNAGLKEQATLGAQLSAMPAQGQIQAQNAGLATTAQELAKVRVEAQANLPKVQQNANLMLSVIRGLKNDPALKGVVGLNGQFNPKVYIRGTPEQRALTKIKQIQGQTFLQAYQTLKGGGQITEVEGAKAEAAMARLDRAQGYKDYVDALNDLEGVVNGALNSAKQQAGGQQPASSQTGGNYSHLWGN